MTSIRFFTPICYGNQTKSPRQFLLEKVDDYFYLSGRKAQVINGDKNKVKEIHPDKRPLLLTALKVASYFTVILPIILLVMKCSLRAGHTFHWEPSKKATPSKKTTPSQIDPPTTRIFPETPPSPPTTIPEIPLPSTDNSTNPSEEQSKQIKDHAATTIQHVFRDYRARIEKKQQQETDQKVTAATKIQKFWRGHRGRLEAEKKRRPLLPIDFVKKAQTKYIEGNKYKSLPKAAAGNTSVYFPPDIPIVLKMCGKADSQKRFGEMQNMHQLCAENQYQRLVVPKAHQLGEFLFETRLPIAAEDTKEQIGLYIENKDLFTKAVRELTSFFCQSFIDDVLGGTRDPYNTLSETPMARYDNICLYIEAGEGKLALVDLQHFRRLQKDEREWRCVGACKKAISFFPYHLEEILEVAKQFDPNIDNQKKELEEIQEGILKRFEIAYISHAQFLTDRTITIANLDEGIVIKDDQWQAIEKKIVEFIREVINKKYQGIDPKVLNLSQEELNECKQEIAGVRDLLTTFFKESISEKKSILEKKSIKITNSYQLLFYRTLQIGSIISLMRAKNRAFPFKMFYFDFEEMIKKTTEKLKLDELSSNTFIDSLINEIFDGLVEQKVIAYHNSGLDLGLSVRLIFF